MKQLPTSGAIVAPPKSQPWRVRPSGRPAPFPARGLRRSRHGLLPDRGTGASEVGGKERRPSCWCRALTVELAARELVIGGAGGVRRLGGIGLRDNLEISEVVPEVVLCRWYQATSTKGERCRYCRESSTHSTRPCSRSIASATMGEPAIQRVVQGSSNHCRNSARYSGVW